MDHRSTPNLSSSRFSLALYGAAVTTALAAASVAGVSALRPAVDGQPVLVVSQAHISSPARIAGLIEPVVQTVAPPPAVPAPVMAAQSATLVKPATAQLAEAALPPLPLRRPCLECQKPATVAATAPTPVPIAVAAAAPIAPEPVEQPYDIASVQDDGPVPPLPVGVRAGEGADPGLLMRGGQAVVAGGSELVGGAWNLSGQAVGGLVRGVRALTF